MRTAASMQPRHRSWAAQRAPDPHRVPALSQAVDLAQAPRLAQHMRRLPLPVGIDTLIRLAAGCRETLGAAEASTSRDPDFIVAAAELYLRQVVCFPGADPYRVLGVSAQAPRSEMRRHLRDLILWLHPDRNDGGGDRALMRRVLEAWEAVNDPEVRRRAARGSRRHRRPSAYRPSWISRPLPKAGPRRSLGSRLLLALRLAVVAASLVIPGFSTLSLFGLAEFLISIASDQPRIRKVEPARAPHPGDRPNVDAPDPDGRVKLG